MNELQKWVQDCRRATSIAHCIVQGCGMATCGIAMAEDSDNMVITGLFLLDDTKGIVPGNAKYIGVHVVAPYADEAIKNAAQAMRAQIEAEREHA